MLEEIMEIVVSGLVSVAGVLLSFVIALFVAYLDKIKKETIQRIGEAEYESNKRLALDLVRIVEERFRLGEVVGSKSEEFEKMLTERVPYLDAEEVKYLKDLAVRRFDEEIGKYKEK